MRFFTVYREQQLLFQLQVSPLDRVEGAPEVLDHDQPGVPGAIKGVPWLDLMYELSGADWSILERALARVPDASEQPFTEERGKLLWAFDSYLLEGALAGWPQTWPVGILPGGLRPFVRVVELDQQHQRLRTSVWANIVRFPGIDGFNRLYEVKGPRYLANERAIAHEWVTTTGLPWPWAFTTPTRTRRTP